MTDKRECGACGMCCKLPHVRELNKPIDTWCQHWRRGQGCTIYAGRPKECAKFTCGWLAGEFGPEWFPARCKMIVMTAPGALMISVDPAYPLAWQREPYYAQLLKLAQRVPVLIRIGRRFIDLTTKLETIRTQAEIEGRSLDN